MLFRFIIETHHKLEDLVDFGVFKEFDSPNIVGVEHILVHPWDLIGAVLALNTLGKHFNMSTNFPDEGVSSSLEDQTDWKVRIILLLLETRIGKSPFEGKVAPRFVWQLVTHALCYCNLTHYQFPLNKKLLLQIFVFLNHSLKS